MDRCLICQNKTSLFSGKIYKCQKCGFGQTEDTKLQQSDYHRDETYKEEERLFNNIFLKRVNIISGFKKSGRVLEIGCSTGIMLDLLKKRGWQVRGVELSQAAARVAQKRGIKVVVDNFNKINLKEKFDVVILNHTLEHLENPVEIIKKIKNLLLTGGLIYIDLPNFGGLSAKLMGKNWPLLLPEEHLWHFTEKSLKILLKKNDFKIIFIEKASGIWDYGNPLWGLILSLLTFKKRFFIEVLTAIPAWIVTKLGIGSDLMIIAKKI